MKNDEDNLAILTQAKAASKLLDCGLVVRGQSWIGRTLKVRAIGQ
jgi:hypothetical protein